MTIGTRSLLFGAHCFFIHPVFVALAWFKLYGFPWDPRLWVAFVIHDWGYWGCRDMDGERGELHPWWAGRIAKRWFPGWPPGLVPYNCGRADAWLNFLVNHSRFLAKQRGCAPSLLCWADKLAFALQPWWLYLPLARLTGELDHYLRDAAPRYGMAEKLTARTWHRACIAKQARIAYEGAAAHWRSEDEKLSPADKHVDTLTG